MAIGSVTVVPEEGGSGMTNDQEAKSYFIGNIHARDALLLSPSARGSMALVEDASDDPTIESGPALYFWNGEKWQQSPPDARHILKSSKSFTGGIVSLEAYKDIYKTNISNDTTFILDVSGLGDITDKVVTFELHIDMTAVSILTFPPSTNWIDTPVFGSVGKYIIVFRSNDGGVTWLGNLAYRE